MKAKGFTLIELLVVIAIIGILASIVLVSLSSAQAKGRDAKRVSDLRSVQLALEEYYNDNLSYPISLSALSGTYLPTLPTDPRDNSTQYAYYALGTKVGAVAPCSGSNPAIAYHLGAGLEVSSNTALLQDSNQAATWNGMGVCSGTTGYTSGFNGQAATTVNSNGVNICATGSNTLTPPSLCYDLTN